MLQYASFRNFHPDNEDPPRDLPNSSRPALRAPIKPEPLSDRLLDLLKTVRIFIFALRCLLTTSHQLDVLFVFKPGPKHPRHIRITLVAPADEQLCLADGKQIADFIMSVF